MTLRSDIHAALDPVTPAAPHLPSVIVDAVTAVPPPRRGWRPAPTMTVVGAVVLILIAVLAAVGLRILSSAPGRTTPAGAPTAPPAAFVITTWVKDPSVVNGPYPGYRPQMTLMYRGTLASVRPAKVVREPSGGDYWVVQFTLDSEGAQVFGSLTRAAAAACAGDCPERHLAMWLDLTQDDVDNWNERATVAYRPVSQGGKLLSDPYILSPVTSGQGFIQGNFSQQEATTLARRLGGG